MKKRPLIKRVCLIIIFSFGLVTIHKLNAQSSVQNTLSNYLQALNKNDYLQVQPVLGDTFTIEGMDRLTSLLQFYGFVHYKKNKQTLLDSILIQKEDHQDNKVIMTLKQVYQDRNTRDVSMQLVEKNGLWKIEKINQGWLPKNFQLITRGSFNPEEIFGDNPIKNIVRLHIINMKDVKQQQSKNYTVFYEGDLAKEANYTLDRLERLEQILHNNFGFDSIKHENVVLTHQQGSTMLVSNSADLPWSIVLPEQKTNRLQKINDFISTTISHEISENTLVTYCGLANIRYRWFREGVSELIAFTYARAYDSTVAQRYFLEKRLEEAIQFQQKGHLLDWRGRAKNPSDDVGSLYGSAYHYENQLGQYGRTFRFFKRLYEEYGSSRLQLMISALEKERASITPDRLLHLFKEIYAIDVVFKLASY